MDNFNFKKVFDPNPITGRFEFLDNSSWFDPANYPPDVYKIDELKDGSVRLYFCYDRGRGVVSGGEHYRIKCRYMGTIIFEGNVKYVKRDKNEKSSFKLSKGFLGRRRKLVSESSLSFGITIESDKVYTENLKVLTFKEDGIYCGINSDWKVSKNEDVFDFNIDRSRCNSSEPKVIDTFEIIDSPPVVTKVEELSNNQIRLHFYYSPYYEHKSDKEVLVYEGTLICEGSKVINRQKYLNKDLYEFSIEKKGENLDVIIKNNLIGDLKLTTESIYLETLEASYAVDGKVISADKQFSSEKNEVKQEHFLISDYINEVDSYNYDIPIVVGMDKNKKLVVEDLTTLGSILMAGSTGSGKSMFLKQFLYTVKEKMTPEKVRLICIEPKMIGEISMLNGSPYMMEDNVTSIEEAVKVLERSVREMKRRNGIKRKPSIVILIDEVSDIMINSEKGRELIYALVENGSKVGIYTILSTSIPSERVLTDELISKVKSRIAFAMTNQTDSNRVIGDFGAEGLKGRGDLLFKSEIDTNAVRLQSLYVD